MSKRSLPGINIQYPWSELLVTGKKTIETRSYPLPKKFINIELAIIETPGKEGKKFGITKARIIGTIIFSGSKKYESKLAWTKDYNKHLVTETDPMYSFDSNKPKYGWIVESVTILKKPVAPPEIRGIIFAKGCKVQF